MRLFFGDYRFVPQSDITAYELALLMPLLAQRSDFDYDTMMETIIARWVLPDICRHLQPRSGVKHDFCTALCMAINTYQARKEAKNENPAIALP